MSKNHFGQTKSSFEFSRFGTNMFGYSNVQSNDDITYAIITGNINKVKELVNELNINKILNVKNKYTALHYAVTLPYNDVTEYLLNLGADLEIQQYDNKTAIDLLITSNNKFMFGYIKDKNEESINNLTHKIKILEAKNTDLYDSNNYHLKSLTNADTINNKLETQINKLKNENQHLKRKFEDKESECDKINKKLATSETAFCNLLKSKK